MRPSPLTWMALAAAALALPIAADESLVSRRYLVRFPPSLRLQAEAVAAEADPLTERLGRELGVEPGARREIVLTDSSEGFDTAVGAPQPGWVVGVAQPSRNRLVLRQGSVKGLRRVTRHEVAHLLVGQALGETDALAPRWLHEGAAKYFGGDWTPADRAALAEGAKGGRLPTLDELVDFPANPEQSAVAYAESYVLVEYLVSLHPTRSLAPFLEEFRHTGDARRALARTYRLSPEEVEAGWHAAMAEKVRAAPVSIAVESTLFLLLVLVFLFAYLRVRRRSLEIKRRMEEDELLDRLFEETRRREAEGGQR